MYDKMRESKCACGQKCDHGPPGRCKARHALPERFTKKGKKKSTGKPIARVGARPKFY
jgi:hypothetical protein